MNTQAVIDSLASEDRNNLVVGIGALSIRRKRKLLAGGLGEVANQGRRIRTCCNDFAIASLLDLGVLYAREMGFKI